MVLKSLIPQGGGSGGGTVTSIASGPGIKLTPDPITASGSVETLFVVTGAVAMKVGTTAPSSPAVGDLWVDTN